MAGPRLLLPTPRPSIIHVQTVIVLGQSGPPWFPESRAVIYRYRFGRPAGQWVVVFLAAGIFARTAYCRRDGCAADTVIRVSRDTPLFHMDTRHTPGQGYCCIPANTRHLPNVVLMLGRRLRRRPNIKTTLVQCLVSLPSSHPSFAHSTQCTATCFNISPGIMPLPSLPCSQTVIARLKDAPGWLAAKIHSDPWGLAVSGSRLDKDWLSAGLDWCHAGELWPGGTQSGRAKPKGGNCLLFK